MLRNLTSTLISSDSDHNSEPKVELCNSPEIESVIIEKGPCGDSLMVAKKSRDLKEFESLNACGKEISQNIIMAASHHPKQAKLNDLKANSSLESLNYWQSFFASKLGSIGKFSKLS